MKNLREALTGKFVVVTCIVIFLLAMPAVWIPSYTWLADLNQNWAEVIRYSLTAVITCVLMWIVWGKCIFTLKNPNFFKNLFTFGLLGLIGAVGAFVFSYDAIDTKPTAFIFLGCVLMNLAIAISEEFLFRGVILTGLLKAWGPARMKYAVLIACVIFGLRHLLNLITKPEAVFGTLAQVVFTFMAGTYLCAVYLRTQNICVCILIHFLEDFSTSVWQIYSTSAAASASADVTISGAVMMVLLQIPYVIFAILMLRDKRWKLCVNN